MMRTMTIWAVTAIVTMIFANAPANAQELSDEPGHRAESPRTSRPDTDASGSLWVVSMRIDRRSLGGSGISGSIDWVRDIRWGFVQLGADVATLRGTRWAVAKLGVTWLPHRRMSLATTVEAGPGWSNDGFLYRRTKSEAGYSVVPGRLMLTAMHQYFSVQNLFGHVVQPTADFGFGTAAARLGYGFSVAGYDTEYVFVRGTYAHRHVSGFGGASIGRFIPDLAAKLEVAPGAESQYEIFGGITFPIARLALTIAISRYATSDATRHSLQIVTRIPAP